MAKYAKSEARQWVRNNFRGYFTVLYTPFLPDGEIDEAGLRHNVEATLARPGVGGLSVHSIHQEFWTLTDAERKRVTDIVLETVAGRAPVVVGVSDTAARTVVEFARHAQSAGADALMVWPPYYGVRTPQGVIAFYEYVAERIDIGLFAYSTTLAELGFYLTPEMVHALLPIEHLCGVQDSSMSFASYAAMMELVGEQIAVTTSLEETFLFGKITFGEERAPNFMLGSSRPVLVQTAAQPHCQRFIEAVFRQDYLVAAQHLRTISGIAQKLQSRFFARGYHHVALFKQIAGLLGMASGGVRAPLSAPSATEIDECIEVLVGAGLLARPAAG